MRILKRILLIILCLILVFVGHVLVSSGFFRTIEPAFEGSIVKKVALKGAEDITISQRDSFALISATSRMIYPPSAEEKGGLYLIDLTNRDFTHLPLTADFPGAFAPHGISMFKKDSTYQVMAINHTHQGHSIEVFELNGDNLRHLRTLRDPAMIRPNDLVIVDENRFYFTNDHKYTQGFGKVAEEYLGLSVSNVVYHDGNSYREVAKGIAYANGINIDQERDLLFVASARKFLVKVYQVQEDGSLTFVEDIPCGTGVDNIEFDEDKNLWIGAHPSLLRFTAYAKGNQPTSPSEIIKISYRKEGDYSVETVYLEKGDEMSASTVAAVFDNLIFTGNLMEDHFLILERDR